MSIVATAGERPAYLRLQAIRKSYETFEALKGIDLAINEGELVCFLGPSGCGKTTLLRVIAGLDRQTSGRIVQAGIDVSDRPPSQRDFGIVFQSYALFPNLTAFDNVAYGLVNRGMAKAEIASKVQALAELVQLGQHLHKFPAQLSGGQQQRVALARALALSPGLLLLDEPLSALDAQVRQHLRREIKEVQRRLGVTTIMVTHDQEEALTMADRIVLMNAGQIEQVGTPIDIYHRPANAFVAGFIGQMCFLPARRDSSGAIVVAGQTIAGLDAPSSTGDVMAAIRPEDVEIVPAGATGIAVTVADIEFCGSFVRLQLAAGEARIAADLPPGVVPTDIAPGAALNVRLPAAKMKLYLRSGA